MAPARSIAGRLEAVVPHFSDLLPLFLQPKICIKFQTLQKLVFWTTLAIFCDIFANFTWILLHFGFHLGHFFIIWGDFSFTSLWGSFFWQCLNRTSSTRILELLFVEDTWVYQRCLLNQATDICWGFQGVPTVLSKSSNCNCLRRPGCTNAAF